MPVVPDVQRMENAEVIPRHCRPSVGACMNDPMSPTKLGFGILWPAFWTGLPIKLALAVLFLAFGIVQLETSIASTFLLLLASPVTVLAVPTITLGLGAHIGEGAGIILLFLLAIPIDVWALRLVGRTFFLERCRREPPAALGLTLWWKCALVGAIYLPILWFVEGAVTDAAISAAHALFDGGGLEGTPVAERISIELILWGSVSTAALAWMLIIGLSLVGRMIRGTVQMARHASENYEGLIARWDLMRVPADQGLLLTILSSVAVALSILFWSSLPQFTPHPHECCRKVEVKAEPEIKPLETIKKNENLIAQLAARVEFLIEQQAAADLEKEKNKPKGEGGDAAMNDSETTGSAAPAAMKP